jgi:RNA polymerase sigma-70 factor (ECF subfamily)
MAEYGSEKMAEELGTDISDLTDESLVRRINEGNHDAFAALVTRHSRRFYSIAYRLLFNRDDAEDIVQEAFLKLWRRPGSFSQSKGAKFTTWFYRVVANLCLDHNRKKKPLPLDSNVQIPDRGPGQELLLDQRQKQAMLDHFIAQLPERQQLALNLCFYEGLSNKEAADIIGVELKALQSLIMRAKTTLREKMKDLGM